MLFCQLYLLQEETHLSKADLAPQREEDFIGLPGNLQTVSITNLAVKLFCDFLFCCFCKSSAKSMHMCTNKMVTFVWGMLYILW